MPTAENASADASKMSDADVLELATALVEAFLELLKRETPGHDILDADLLPAKRPALESAFRLAIMTEPRRNMRQRLIEAGTRLAQFQVGVGRRVLIVPAPSICAEPNRQTPQSHRLGLLLGAVESDATRLRGMLVNADRTAFRRHPTMNTERVFADDGTYTWHGHHAFH